MSIPLRMTVGGYHAPTYFRCFLVSNGVYWAVSVLAGTAVWKRFLYSGALSGQKSPPSGQSQDTQKEQAYHNPVLVYPLLNYDIVLYYTTAVISA